MSKDEMPRRKKMINLLAFLGGILGLALLLVMYVSFHLSVGLRPSPSPPGEYASFERVIQAGDDAFRSRDYNRAVILYRRADQLLSESLGFENESPSKDEAVLQHYHNAKMLLRARIELTLVAEDVSRLKTATVP